MTPKRIRPKPRIVKVQGWHMDFNHGAKYRFIRPDAAAEVVSIENEAKRLHMRQPDAWELEAMGKKPLVEPGEWKIVRAEVDLKEFA